MTEILATLFAGTFFGAALYINLAQHPATIETGGNFPGLFFPPMYRKAAPMQIILALGGTVLGAIQWYVAKSLGWLAGAVLLVSVIPITLVFIKPINDQLLDPDRSLSTEEIESLLRQWNARHWVRTIASGLSFVCYLGAMADL